MHRYENLTVWQRSIDVCRDIYSLTEHLPTDERFGLRSQMRRASVSVPSNIAEGAAGRTAKEFGRFLRMALGSAHELDTQLAIAKEVEMLEGPDVEQVRGALREVRAMLVGLRRSVKDQPG